MVGLPGAGEGIAEVGFDEMLSTLAWKLGIGVGDRVGRRVGSGVGGVPARARSDPSSSGLDSCASSGLNRPSIRGSRPPSILFTSIGLGS